MSPLSRRYRTRKSPRTGLRHGRCTIRETEGEKQGTSQSYRDALSSPANSSLQRALHLSARYRSACAPSAPTKHPRLSRTSIGRRSTRIINDSRRRFTRDSRAAITRRGGRFDAFEKGCATAENRYLPEVFKCTTACVPLLGN